MMPGEPRPKAKLYRRYEAAIAALLASGSLAEAAAAAHIGLATIKRWVHEPEFAAAYAAARKRVLDDAVAGLHGTLGLALEALRRNLSPDVPPAVQVRALVAAFELTLKAIAVLDHEARLTALERKPDAPKLTGWPFDPSRRVNGGDRA